MMSTYKAADVDLANLGVGDLNVRSLDAAQTAIKDIASAIDKVANQRAVIGSEVSRLNFTYAANTSYGNNISQAESRIRDVDFAKVSTELVASQIAQQAAASMLSQNNSSRSIVLSLLQ